MKRVTNTPIVGRHDKWLGIDMYEPEFGETRETLVSRIPDIQVLTGVKLFIQAANNLPVDPQTGRRTTEQMRIADKALDVLDQAVEKNLEFVDLEDQPYDVIMVGLDQILPSHPFYGIHTPRILEQLDLASKIPE